MSSAPLVIQLNGCLVMLLSVEDKALLLVAVAQAFLGQCSVVRTTCLLTSISGQFVVFDGLHIALLDQIFLCTKDIVEMNHVGILRASIHLKGCDRTTVRMIQRLKQKIHC